MVSHSTSLRDSATRLGLTGARARDDGTLVNHSDELGYQTDNRLSALASPAVGAYLHVITDDVPGAAAAHEP